MARVKAMLIFHPDRRDEQLAFVRERVATLFAVGDQLWVSMEDSQLERFAAQGIAVDVIPEADLVMLPAVTFEPLAAEPDPPPDLVARPGPDAPAYQIVQFQGPTADEWIGSVAETGGVYVQTLPPHLAIFRLTQAQADATRALEYVRWVGPYHPAYALNFALAGRNEPFSAADLQTLAVDPERVQQDELGNVQLTFFDDVDLDALGQQLPPPTVGEAGGMPVAGARVVSPMLGGFVVAADGPDDVRRLLLVPGVFAVEPFFPPQLGNNPAGRVTLVNQVRDVGRPELPVNLDGTGETVGIIDSGLDTGVAATLHVDVRGRVILLRNLNNPANAIPDALPHGTHVAGITAGNGTGGAVNRGVAPAAQIVFHAPLAANMLTGIVTAHLLGARAHNNSWGTIFQAGNPVTNNPYTAGNTGAIDRLGLLYGDSLIVFITHNQETDANADGRLDALRLTPESTAKNILAVGASENVRPTSGFAGNYNAPFPRPAAGFSNFGFAGVYNTAPVNALANGVAGPPNTVSDNANQVALFSNRGRVNNAAGGRIRPDVVAPGTNILSLASTAAGAAANTYQFMSGTSMAAPHATGAAALVRQFYRTRFGRDIQPVLLAETAVPAAPPLPQFVDRPAVGLGSTGFTFAWVAPAAPGAQKNIVALRTARGALTPTSAAPSALANNVGEHPAPIVACHGDATLLLYRDAANVLHLARFQADLAADPAFNSALNATTRPDDTLAPALLLNGDEAAVVWADHATTNLLFRRFSAATGAAIDAAPITLGTVSETSGHCFIAHGDRGYGVAWVQISGGASSVNLRVIEQAGTLLPAAGPSVVHTQPQAIHAAHLAWCPTHTPRRFAVVWADSRTSADGDLFVRFAAADAQLGAAPARLPVQPAAGTPTFRQPFVAPRVGGMALFWQDNRERNVFDLYRMLLDQNGAAADPAIPPTQQIRTITSVPGQVSRFAARLNALNVAVVYQGSDEVNPDRLATLAINQPSQVAAPPPPDAGFPLLDQGRYVNHTLLSPASPDVTRVAIVWRGGEYALLRSVPPAAAGSPPVLEIVPTSADGVHEPAFANHAPIALLAAPGNGQAAYELDWTGPDASVLAIAIERVPGRTVSVARLVAACLPDNTFGAGGVVSLAETADLAPDVGPQVGHRLTGALALNEVYAAYGRQVPGGAELRLARLNTTGAQVGTTRTLATAAGAARHGWFQVVRADARLVAAWHASVGADTHIFVRQFNLDGSVLGPARDITNALAGASLNACIAPRPRAANPNNREYGVAWEHIPAVAQPARILFSRLAQDGTVIANPPGLPAISTRNFEVVSPPAPLPANWAAGAPQLVATATHEPPAPPAPAPALASNPISGYGLAWLETNVAGRRVLKFRALDENGRPCALTRAPAPATTAPVVQVSDDAADVEDYKLIWNGRGFRLTWAERQSGQVRHMQTALTRYGSRSVHDNPSGPLVRATLINGATNIDATALPNVASPAAPAPASGTGGYGWGRLNMRQSVTPAPPITFHARDDAAVGPGRRILYRFDLPAATSLLRVTLSWNDMPGALLTNRLLLSVQNAGAGLAFYGNQWNAAAPLHASRPFAIIVAPPANEGVHNTQQVVIENPPAGSYVVEVRGVVVQTHNLNQLQAQPFALVFVGSGREVRFQGLAVPPGAGVFY